MKKDVYDRAIITRELTVEDFCNLPKMLLDICEAGDSFNQFTFTRGIDNVYAGLAVCFEQSIQDYLNQYKNEILTLFDGNKGHGNNQIFETYVTFINDTYYVNYLFSVIKALDVIKENHLKPQNMDINTALSFSSLITTNTISQQVQNDNPIIIVHNPATVPPTMVIDGNHRVKQKYMQGCSTIQAYILGQEYVDAISICQPIYKLIELLIIACDTYIAYRTGQVETDKLLRFLKFLDTQNIMR